MSKKEMEYNSILQFKKYKVNKLFFSEERLSDDNKDSFKVNPSFMKEINYINDNDIEVTLGCKIESTDENPFPFNLEVVLTGMFALSVKDQSAHTLVDENAVAILYPYLRSTVSLLTTSANEASLILPTLNIVKLFKEYEKKAQGSLEQ